MVVLAKKANAVITAPTVNAPSDRAVRCGGRRYAIASSADASGAGLPFAPGADGGVASRK